MKARTLITAAGAALALAAPAAHAMPLYPEGDGPAASSHSALRGLQAVTPDDLQGNRSVGAASSSAASFYSAAALTAMGQRGQAMARFYTATQADQTDALSRYLVNNTTAVRPDDRAGPLGIGETPVAVVTGSPSSGFDWRDTGIGVGSAGVLLLLGASLAATSRRRSASALG